MTDPQTPTILPIDFEKLKLPVSEHVYFNGFQSRASASDVVIILTVENEPVAQIIASHTVVKTMAKKLVALLEAVENQSNVRIPDLDEWAQIMQNAGQ